MTPEELFTGHPESLAVCRAVQDAVARIGEAQVAVTRSQVAFRRHRGFAYVWRPGQYVRSDVPAVLSISLPRQISSDRFKEVVHPSENVWMHHLEISTPTELDDEVLGWLAEAYQHAA
jgi:hypothetical protein